MSFKDWLFNTTPKISWTKKCRLELLQYLLAIIRIHDGKYEGDHWTLNWSTKTQFDEIGAGHDFSQVEWEQLIASSITRAEQVGIKYGVKW